MEKYTETEFQRGQIRHFCTDKEQETCQVEKMGCKGCYYNQEKENERE